MAAEPDRIRADIAATRAELTRDVDALADRTSPARVARRRWGSVKERAINVRERVMGVPSRATERVRETAEGLGERAGDAAHEVADTVRRVPETIGQRTQGNPIAVGIIAFGAGLLVASLLPETEVERRAGERVREHAGDLAEQVKAPLAEAAAELRDDLTDSGRQAMDQVKETTAQAVQETKQAASQAGR